MLKEIALDALKKMSEYFAETSLGSATTGWLYQPPLNYNLKNKINENKNKRKSK